MSVNDVGIAGQSISITRPLGQARCSVTQGSGLLCAPCAIHGYIHSQGWLETPDGY